MLVSIEVGSGTKKFSSPLPSPEQSLKLLLPANTYPMGKPRKGGDLLVIVKILVDIEKDCSYIDTPGHDREYVYIHPSVTDAQIREAITLALSNLRPEPLTVTPEIAEDLKSQFKQLSGCSAPVTLITGLEGIKMVQHDDQGWTWVVTSKDWGISWDCILIKAGNTIWANDGNSLDEAMHEDEAMYEAMSGL